MAHILKIYNSNIIIGKIENPNFRDLINSIDKIQFSKKSIVLEKSFSNKLIVKWDYISGFTFEFNSYHEILKDSLLYPSKDEVYVILKSYIADNPSFKISPGWKKEDDFNQKNITRNLIISLQIITAVISVLLLILLFYVGSAESSSLDFDFVGGLGFIFTGFFMCSVYLKRIFYLKDTRKAGDRGLYSSLHEFIMGLALIVFGMIIVFN